MTPEDDYIEPEYEAAEVVATGASLPRRVAQIIFYGGSAAALGLLLLVYASPTFAARVSEAMPESLLAMTAGDSSGCSYGGCCGSKSAETMPAALAATETGESSCCSTLSRASMMASAESACGSCPSSQAGESFATSGGGCPLSGGCGSETPDEVAAAEPEIPDATEVFAGGL